jgi:hypothetical protein
MEAGRNRTCYANWDVPGTRPEWTFRAGIAEADYRIPEYMREEPWPPHNVTFDVPDSALDTVFETL